MLTSLSSVCSASPEKACARQAMHGGQRRWCVKSKLDGGCVGCLHARGSPCMRMRCNAAGCTTHRLEGRLLLSQVDGLAGRERAAHQLNRRCDHALLHGGNGREAHERREAGRLAGRLRLRRLCHNLLQLGVGAADGLRMHAGGPAAAWHACWLKQACSAIAC